MSQLIDPRPMEPIYTDHDSWPALAWTVCYEDGTEDSGSSEEGLLGAIESCIGEGEELTFVIDWEDANDYEVHRPGYFSRNSCQDHPVDWKLVSIVDGVTTLHKGHSSKKLFAVVEEHLAEMLSFFLKISAA